MILSFYPKTMPNYVAGRKSQVAGIEFVLRHMLFSVAGRRLKFIT